MIEINDLSKSFEDFKALDNLCLHVDKGSIFGLIGVNGSGKTTLIKHLTGVLKPDSGSIKIDGQDVWDNIEIKEKVGYIPDELYFFDRYTIKQERDYYKNLYPKWDDKLFNTMISDFGLNMNGRLAKFSKGMQKQAAFAFALCSTPEVMILDEPIDGLDPIMRKKVWSYVLSQVAERNMTVLISSHNLRELEGICDSVGILSQGKIRFSGKLDELKSNEQSMTLEELFFYEMEDK